MAASYQQTYNMKVSLQQLQNIIANRDFAKSLNLEPKSQNPSSTGIWYRFHHGVTFTSWGEKITITLTKQGDSETQVDIHSECGMPTQVVDWGKNKQVVSNIYEYLSANAHRFSTAESVTPVAPAPQPAEATYPRFCPNCGTAVAGRPRFCGHCGHKLR